MKTGFLQIRVKKGRCGHIDSSIIGENGGGSRGNGKIIFGVRDPVPRKAAVHDLSTFKTDKTRRKGTM